MTWLRDWSHGDRVALRVLCLPPAGTAAHVYRRWPHLLPPDIGVVAVELPGHGTRLNERPLVRMTDVLGPLAAEVAATLSDRPLVVFGHSMGGTLGAELIRFLKREHGVVPALMVAAACEAPRLEPRGDHAHRLTDEGVLDFLHRMGGTPPELLADDDYLAMLLPALRADLTVLAGPRPADGRPLDCPVRLYLGERDTGVDPERAAAWRAESDGDFTVRTFAAGHFFVQELAEEVLGRLRADVDRLRTAVGRRS